MVQNKQNIFKILIFVDLVFRNNFECDLKKFHKMDPSKQGFLRYRFCFDSLIILIADVEFIKNIQNYYDEELKDSYIFQKLDNLSRVKWYISIIYLKWSSQLGFHYFGKAH